MSRLSRSHPSRRAGRLLSRLTVAVAGVAAGAVVFSGVAAAEPAPATPPPVPDLLAELTRNVPQVGDLLGQPGVTDLIEGITGQQVGNTTAQEFLFPAPTFGCGMAGSPVTATVASAQSGPNFPMPPWIERGQLRFQALPAHAEIPQQSDLRVAWFNTTTLQGGVVPLDDTVMNVPLLAKTVATGQGNILAAVFGQVHYPSGTTCTALGTVGQFTA